MTHSPRNARDYRKEFEEIELLGKGGFSNVFRAKKDNIHYAIKKVAFNPTHNDTDMKEVKILKSLDNQYVVKYFGHWIEVNYYNQVNDGDPTNSGILNNPLKNSLLHIQMELCFNSLFDVINEVDYPEKNIITIKDYFFFCGLLIQLLEAVQYLHNQSIIHRDLKPQNILITHGQNFKILVKLSDFGLSTYNNIKNETETQTAYIGTPTYRAPEVAGGNYNNKADIYSLGVIVKELFNIDINDNNQRDGKPKNKEMEKIGSHYENLKKVSVECLSVSSSSRPTCEQLLKTKGKWNYVDDNSPHGLLSWLNTYLSFGAVGSIGFLIGLFYNELKIKKP